MFKEFKEFAMKGSLVDMATGIIIGAAFSSVVESLVTDIIMPPIGMMMGGVNFSNLFSVINQGIKPVDYPTIQAAVDAGAVTVNYGLFINNIISFIVVALAIFLVIRSLNRLKRQEQEIPKQTPANEVLLAEIRDLLKDKTV